MIWPKNKNLPSSGHKNTSEITNEFAIMRNINHPNVLKIQDMLYLSYSNSFTNLKQSIQAFSNVQRVYLIFKLAEGMKYIHSCKIMHVNVNPSSIFISDGFTFNSFSCSIFIMLICAILYIKKLFLIAPSK